MKPKEILQYNKRCSEVLGYSNPIIDKDFYFVEHYNYNNKSKIPKLLELNFEKRFLDDWNWIMEVVEAIEKLNFNVRITKACITIETSVNCEFSLKTIFSFHSDNQYPIIKKEAVVLANNQFLIWYEQNK